jgi:hypothetical protein
MLGSKSVLSVFGIIQLNEAVGSFNNVAHGRNNKTNTLHVHPNIKKRKNTIMEFDSSTCFNWLDF